MLTDYFFETIGGLLVILWSFVIMTFSGRIKRVEDANAINTSQIHSVDGDLKNKIDEKFRELDTKLEQRRVETKEDVVSLRREMLRGHDEIMRELKSSRHG